MQAHSKDVVKDITTASQLEAELILSQAQHGIAVVDVYNAEWGSCKALSETFRRLFTDAGDVVHLRFFSAECNAISESLANPEEPKVAAPRPRGMTCAPDTQAAAWGPILESRRKHSKPYFVFYKEGKVRGRLEGIDTPKICQLVQELCRAQTPATDYLTNPDAMRFWEVYFSLGESEVPARDFVDALQREAALHDVRPLLREDVNAITAAVGTDEAGNISAAAFQEWVAEAPTVAGRTAECIAAAAAAAPMRAQQPVLEATEEGDEREPEQEEGEEGKDAAEEPSQAAAAGGEEELAREGEAAATEEAMARQAVTAEELREGNVSAEGNQEDAAAAPPAGEAVDQFRELGDAAEEKAEGEVEAAPADEPSASPAEDTAALHADEDGGEEEYPQEGAPQEEPAEEQYPQEAAASVDNTAEEPTETTPPAADATRQPDEEEEAAAGDSPDAVLKDGQASPVKEDELRELGDPVPVEETEEAVTTTTTATTGVHQIFLDRWVTVTEDEMRVWNLVAALPLHYPAATSLLLQPNNASITERAARLVPPVAEEFPTLAEHLDARGVPAADVNMMCLAAEQKVGSESLSYGKLALILISSDAEGTAGLLPESENLSAQLSAGTVVESHPSLAFTALCLCASEAYPDEFFYYVPPKDAAPLDVTEGAELALAALTPLHASTPAADTGRYFRIVGLPKVIELATTDDCEDTMVLSQWYTKLRVTAVAGEEVTLEFAEVLWGDAFTEFADTYTARLIEDENKLDKKAAAGSGEQGVEESAELETEEIKETEEAEHTEETEQLQESAPEL